MNVMSELLCGGDECSNITPREGVLHWCGVRWCIERDFEETILTLLVLDSCTEIFLVMGVEGSSSISRVSI